MRQNTPLDNFLGFMKLKGSTNSVSAQGANTQNNEMQGAQAQSATAQDNETQGTNLQEFSAQDFIIANDDELKLCVEAFGKPSDVLSAKEME